MNKKCIMIACAFFVAVALQAKVSLPAFFSDGMVMQQQSQASLWDQNKKTPAFDMIGYFLMYDNPKRMIDFTHVFRLLPQNNGYKYQTIPVSFLSVLPYQSEQVFCRY